MSLNIHKQRILILDFGSQYAQLIARRVREIGVYCEVRPYDWDESSIRAFFPQGIILSGGPETVIGSSTPRAGQVVFELGCPVLGICYGMQTMAAQLGGVVESSTQREFGYAEVEVTDPCHLLDGIEDVIDDESLSVLKVWMSHGDRVSKVPPGFKIVGKTANAPIAAMADERHHFYGLQFHPEVTHTLQGFRLLERFVLDICGLEPLWTPNHIIDDAIKTIRNLVGNDEVILGLSGGVDSAVTAALLHRAIGSQLICVFVDNGLLRLNEATQVMQTFAKHFGIKVRQVKAETEFLGRLRGINDPEEKRKIIGKLFVEIFESEAREFPEVKWLAQGTIYPDVIESAQAGSGKSHVIKSHHNVGGLPEQMDLKLLEPLRELFKDEVRKIGLELGLPAELIHRHPFPGPGLGVRILGEVKKDYADILRLVDDIYMNELRESGWYEKVSQAFAVFLPVKSVGVVGDARQYEYVVALRAVNTIDFMTAEWSRLPHDLLAKVADKILNEVPGVARVTYDISNKPPATIEWE